MFKIHTRLYIIESANETNKNNDILNPKFQPL